MEQIVYYTAVVKIDGKFQPYLLSSNNLTRFEEKYTIVKLVKGQTEKNWFLASSAAEALNNL